MRTNTILVVDDEPKTRAGLQKILEAYGGGRYRVLTADNGRLALEELERERVDLIVTDIRMPEVNGISLVAQAQSIRPSRRPSVILISGHAEFDYAQQGIQLGVVNYLLKPIGKEKLLAAVKKAIEIADERNLAGKLIRIADTKLLASESSAISKPVQEAIDFVDAHLERTFGLSDAADRIGLNPSYLSALFKEQMRMTFSEYVTRRKLQRAKELLLGSNLSISEIAERVGYQTTKYFHRLFRAYEGCSPGQFRTDTAGESAGT